VRIVVTDMTVPGDSGVGLIERARDIRPGLPAILVAGFSDEPLCVPVRGGGFHILRKPVHAEELTRCIDTLLTLAPRSGFDDWLSLRS
jgi:FixJ family two-component response regulator